MSRLEEQLAEAVRQNSLRQVEELLAAGARPTAELLRQVHPKRDDIRVALVLAGADARELGLPWAVSTRRLDVVERLLEHGAPFGVALQQACAQGLLPIVERLLLAGADPDAGNRVTTPLLSALEHGHEGVALRLLEAGADASLAPELVKRTPVFQAVASNLPGAVRALLAAGADGTAPFLYMGPNEHPVDTPPLVLAARLGFAECARELLAEPSVKDGEGRTAYDRAPELMRSLGVEPTRRTPDEVLLESAERGDLVAVPAGADVNARDTRDATKNRTPLMLAAAGGHLPVVKLLLEAGADPSLSDLVGPPHKMLAYFYREGGDEGPRAVGATLGRTALMLAAQAGHLAVCQALPGPADVPDAVGMTALLLAAEKGHLEVVKHLVERGADPFQKGPGKRTALTLTANRELASYLSGLGGKKKPSKAEVMKAVGELDLSLLRSFASRGADLRKGPFLTAACGAARMEQRGALRTMEPCLEDEVLPVVEFLLEAGADVNATAVLGTPLMVATHYAHRRVVERLLAAGADPSVRSDSGEDAFDIAERYGGRFLDLFAGFARRAAPAPQPEVPEPALAPEPVFKPLPGFEALVAELAERCGSQPAALGPGFRCPVQVKRRKGFDLPGLQDSFLSRGAFLFDLDYGQQGPYELALLPTADPLDAVAFMLRNGDLLEFLRELPVPYRLTSLRHDLLSGQLLAPLPDPRAVARRCIELCPDLEEGGLGMLTRGLKKGKLFFWWD